MNKMLVALLALITATVTALSQKVSPQVERPDWDEALNCLRFTPYASKWLYRRADLRHERVIWFARAGDGEFVASPEVAKILNPSAAIELARYMSALDIPMSHKAGIMIFYALEQYVSGSGKPHMSPSGFLVPDPHDSNWFQQKSDDKDIVFFDVHIVDSRDCFVGRVSIGDPSTGEGYDIRYGLPRPDAHNIDLTNYSQNLSTRGCGGEYIEIDTEYVGHWALDLDQEAYAVSNDGSVASSAGGMMRPITIGGRVMGGFAAVIFPGRKAPRVILKGDNVIFELPKYIESPSIARHVIVYCNDSGDVSVRYVLGDTVKMFEHIAIEVRD